MNLVSLPTKPKAIVVDDEPDSRYLCSLIFQKAGYTCTEAENGFDCLVKLAHDHFTFMLLDLNMPGMGGRQVLEKLSELHEHDGMFIMVFTANPALANNLPGRANAVKTKPLSLPEVIKLLQDLKPSTPPTPSNPNQASSPMTPETKTDIPTPPRPPQTAICTTTLR
jgi:CheY-like chemotaxis protein